MIRLNFLAFTLLFIVASASAQGVEQRDDARTIEWRQKIGMDYSMPDFSTSKLNGKVIGNRLAHMLKMLHGNVKDRLYKTMISNIVGEQHNELRFVDVEKFNVTDISKEGDVITIMMKVVLAGNIYDVKSTELELVFVKGVSNSLRTNEMFAYLSRYAKE